MLGRNEEKKKKKKRKEKCSLGHAVSWYILTSLSTGRLRPGSKVKFYLAILMEMCTVEQKIFLISIGLRTADAFPVIASLALELFGGREATIGNVSAVCRLHKYKIQPNLKNTILCVNIDNLHHKM